MQLRAFPAFVFSLSCIFCLASLHAEDFPQPVNTEKSTESPLPAAETARTAQLPPGFQLSVVAAEPLIQNPIAMTIDERGRIWVAENYSWAGNGAGGFDPSQRDRIVVLEDTDADGTFDRRSVFWDEAHKLTSIEVSSDGVWALCLPNLLFLPDRNRDGKLDGPPEIVLNGFNEDTVGHTPANGLKWGPDGWLYGRHGIQATSLIGKPDASESQRFKINTGVWRYHPARGIGEAVLHGLTNSWGFDFDQHGEIFVINTVIGHLWHVIPGVHTQRMYGLDFNPYAFKLVDQVADHVHWDAGEAWNDVRKGVTDRTSLAGGGHAHIGLMIYQGDNWPDEYRHRVYTLNLHGRRINTDILHRQLAGYTATHGPDFCFIQDPWYRGMELLTAPDGTVLIADWSDTGECHDHDGVHRTSGRLYRLAYGTPRPVPTFDLTKLSNAELLDLLNHRNAWWGRQAQRILGERAQAPAAPEAIDALRASIMQRHQQADTPVLRIRLLETMAHIGSGPEEWWISQLQAADEHERAAALRLLVDQELLEGHAPSPTLHKALVELAHVEKSGLVQLSLASALQRLPAAMTWELARSLVASNEFAEDRMLPAMIWYGIEPHVPRQVKEAVSLLQVCQIPLVTECIARRLTLDLDQHPASAEALVNLMLQDHAPDREPIIHGMALALDGWQKAQAPARWEEVTRTLSGSNSEVIRQSLQTLNLVFGDGRTLEELKKLVANGTLPAEVRTQALRSLLKTPPADFAPVLIGLLRDRVMTHEAIQGLALYDQKDIPAKILERLGTYSPSEREAMVQTLTARPSFAKVLLQAVRDGKISPQEISAFHARQIASFGDDDLTRQLTQVWGDVRISAAEKRELMHSKKAQLPAEVLAQANLPAGRMLFQKTCATCHVLYGQGRRLGPDLTGSNRKNIDYLLENIVDPSSSVGAGFRAVVILLDNGRILNGVISEQNDRTLTLQSAQETITLDRRTIDEIKPTTVSLMPDGLLQNLSTEQIRDLFGYLMSSEQVPLPAE